MAHFVHGQAVPGFPGFGGDAGDAIFHGQGRSAGDEGIDAGGVGVQHRFGAGAGGGVVGAGGVRQAVAAQLRILRDGGRAGGLGPAAGGAAAVVLHCPESVLGRRKTLGEPGVRFVGGANVRDAPLIPPHPDGGMQAGQRDCAVQGREGGLQVGSREGGKAGAGGVGGHNGRLQERMAP